MDIEKIYPVGSKNGVPYRAVIGWSDTHQEYYACIEVEQEDVEIFWKMPSHDNLSSVDVIVMVVGSVVEPLMENDREFVLPTDDLRALQEAPHQVLVNPASLQRLELTDEEFFGNPGQYMDAYGTIYADGQVPPEAPPFRPDHQPNRVISYLSYEEFLCIIDGDTPQDEVDQAVYDSVSELNFCAETLKQLYYIDNGLLEEYPGSFGTTQQRRDTLIAQTARQLIEINDTLAMVIPAERRQAIAEATFEELLHLETLFSTVEIDQINRFVHALCRTKLTDFPIAFERGFNPVNGLPLVCPNPASFSWANTVQDGAIGFYQHSGLSLEEAELAVSIQRTDPRLRTEDDWEFLQSNKETLFAFTLEYDGRIG